MTDRVLLNLSHNLVPDRLWIAIPVKRNFTMKELKLLVSARTGSDENCIELYKVENLEKKSLLDSEHPCSDLNDHETIHVVDSNPNSILLQLKENPLVQRYKITREQYEKSEKTAYTQIKALREQYYNSNRDTHQFDDQKVVEHCNQRFGLGSVQQVIDAGFYIKINNINVKGIIKYIGYPSKYIQKLFDLEYKIIYGVKLSQPVGLYDGTDEDGMCTFDCEGKQCAICILPEDVEIIKDASEGDSPAFIFN